MFNPFDPISTTADIAGGIAGDEFTSGAGRPPTTAPTTRR
jgi:hypothetical protein